MRKKNHVVIFIITGKVISEFSVHHSNNRHMARISKQNLLPQTEDIEVEEISQVVTEGAKKENKVQAHCHITSKPYHYLYDNYLQIYDTSIVFGTFMNLKPFYVCPTSTKAMEISLCSKCINPHCLYKPIKKYSK